MGWYTSGIACILTDCEEKAMSDVDEPPELLERVRKEALPRIFEATVPFYAVQNEQVVRDRSGVLFRVGADYFIITCAHYLADIIAGNIYLYVGNDPDNGLPVPIPDALFHGTEDTSRDIAIFKLTSRKAKIIAATKRPIGLADLALDIDRRPGFFVVCGFPQAWLSVLREAVDSAPLYFLASYYAGEPSPTSEPKHDPNVHALFTFERKAIRHDLQEVTLPSLEGIKGISGCGVWRVLDEDQDLKAWRPEKCKLVAVEHFYSQTKGYVQGTWVRHALGRLIDDYPSVRQAMSLLLPK